MSCRRLLHKKIKTRSPNESIRPRGGTDVVKSEPVSMRRLSLSLVGLRGVPKQSTPTDSEPGASSQPTSSDKSKKYRDALALLKYNIRSY